MVKAAARHGWIDERRVVLETLTGIHRAGADRSSPITPRTSPAGWRTRARHDGGRARRLGLRPASERLFAAAQRVIPGGVNSPVRAFRGVGGKPRVHRARAEGA